MRRLGSDCRVVRHLLTLGRDATTWLDGQEASVFIQRGFTIADDDLEYPGAGVRVILHEPSPRGAGNVGRHPEFGSAALVSAVPVTDAAAVLRIASEPELIQNEPTYGARAKAHGYRFLFQINEEAGFGSLYLCGKLGQSGRADDIVAGFLNF